MQSFLLTVDGVDVHGLAPVVQRHKGPPAASALLAPDIPVAHLHRAHDAPHPHADAGDGAEVAPRLTALGMAVGTVGLDPGHGALNSW